MDDPEWWQLFLQYGAAPVLVGLVSTLALLYQGAQNAKREDRRRAEDAAEREKDRQELAKDRAERSEISNADRAHQHDEAAAEREHQRRLAEIARDARLQELAGEHHAANRAAAQRRREELADRWRDERRASHLTLLALLETALKRIRSAENGLTVDDAGNVIKMTEPVSSLDDEFLAEMRRAVAEVQMIGSDQARSAAQALHEAVTAADIRMWLATLAGIEMTLPRAKAKELVETAHSMLAPYIDTIRRDLGTLD